MANRWGPMPSEPPASRVCKECHETKPLAEFTVAHSCRWGRSHTCRPCWNVYVTAYQKGYRKTDPANSDEFREQRRKWTRSSHLRRRFGIDYADYERILAAQGGVCAICGGTELRRHHKFMSIDHDHTSGAIRGILCDNCNQGLGNFKDKRGLLKAAMAYLAQHEAHQAAFGTTLQRTVPEKMRLQYVARKERDRIAREARRRHKVAA